MRFKVRFNVVRIRQSTGVKIFLVSSNCFVEVFFDIIVCIYAGICLRIYFLEIQYNNVMDVDVLRSTSNSTVLI